MFRDGQHRARPPAGAGEALIAIQPDSPSDSGVLEAALVVPEGARSIVIFAHGSTPCACCPCDVAVARGLEHAGFATLLVDLLTPTEADDDVLSGRHALDVPLFTRRIVRITNWFATSTVTRALRVGCFGVGTGAAAALAAAAELPWRIECVVSCGGRLDLVDRSTLARVKAPVLLIEGTAEGGPRADEKNGRALGMNGQALEILRRARLAVVRGATHWLREPSVFGTVAQLALGWFARYLASSTPARPAAG